MQYSTLLKKYVSVPAFSLTLMKTCKDLCTFAIFYDSLNVSQMNNCDRILE